MNNIKFNIFLKLTDSYKGREFESLILYFVEVYFGKISKLWRITFLYLRLTRHLKKQLLILYYHDLVLVFWIKLWSEQARVTKRVRHNWKYLKQSTESGFREMGFTFKQSESRNQLQWVALEINWKVKDAKEHWTRLNKKIPANCDKKKFLVIK